MPSLGEKHVDSSRGLCFTEVELASFHKLFRGNCFYKCTTILTVTKLMGAEARGAEARGLDVFPEKFKIFIQFLSDTIDCQVPKKENQYVDPEHCSLCWKWRGMCLFQMTVWKQALILLCCALSFVDSAPSPVPQRNKYNNSFRLTRSARSRVQQLLKKYVSTGKKNTGHLIPGQIWTHPALTFSHYNSVYFNRRRSSWEISILRTEADSYRTCRWFLQISTAG